MHVNCVSCHIDVSSSSYFYRNSSLHWPGSSPTLRLQQTNERTFEPPTYVTLSLNPVSKGRIYFPGIRNILSIKQLKAVSHKLTNSEPSETNGFSGPQGRPPSMQHNLNLAVDRSKPGLMSLRLANIMILG